jgi:glycosyltransferase involved in cell wall biosynthesis
MFGWEFPPHNSGGLGVACQGIARALKKSGIDVLFVLPKSIGVDEDFEFDFAQDVFLDVVNVNSILAAYQTSLSYQKVRGRYSESIYGATLFDEVMRYGIKGAEIAKRNQFDIIHAHDWLSFPAGVSAKEVSGKPLVVHIHATEFDRTGNGFVDKRVYEVEKMGMDAADHIVSVSEFTKKIIVDNYSISPEKISVAHNGITPEQTIIASPDKSLLELKKNGYQIVLFVGRLTLQKGPDYFLHAAKRILDYAPKTVFAIAGSGDMERQTMELAASLGISRNVLFLGFLRGEALSSVYKAADIFVMPSVSEPFGITPLESLLHDTPVVLSKQSGASEVILHALKTDFWDTEDMADKILSVIKYPSLKGEMARNGHKEVSLQTWDKTANKLAQIYSGLSSASNTL